MAKKAPQGTQTKVETLTIRVSPKMKFGLELLSRKQHRTLTSVAEWALDKALNDKSEGLWRIVKSDYGEDSYYSILEEVWDPHEPDRMVKLAVCYPHLLTYEEELLWKLIKESPLLWNFDEDDFHIIDYKIRQCWDTVRTSLRFRYVRRYFDELKSSVDNYEIYHQTMQLICDEIREDERIKERKENAKLAAINSVLTDDDIPF